MLQIKPGLGLAAIQIGVAKRVAIVLKQITKEHQFLYHELINPQILQTHGSFIGEEGCLSLPGMTVTTKRAYAILVKSDAYQDPYWIDGIQAIAIQHEIDHMNGVLIMDREYELTKYKRNDKIKIKHRMLLTEQEIKFKDFFKYQSEWNIVEPT